MQQNPIVAGSSEENIGQVAKNEQGKAQNSYQSILAKDWEKCNVSYIAQQGL